MSKQDKVTAWMERLGYKFYNDTLGTYGYEKVGMPPVEVETASFFYDVAERSRLETGKHVAFQIMDGADPKGIYDAFDKEIKGDS